GDVHKIAMSLPDVELGTSWGDLPTYKVNGKGFLMHRRPHKTATDPATGEMYDDLLIITVPNEAEKLALVEDDRLPFFTVPHFNGYNAVLVRQSRLGEIDRDEFAEVITEAWATKAPKKLVRELRAQHSSRVDRG
ncbi:MAG: MmcQ/YjbR family DNA-binding protein, partial [Nocardioidaceae bacterium]